MASGKVGAMLQVGGGSGLPHGVKVGAFVTMTSRLYRNPAPVERTLARAGLTDLAHRCTQRLSGGQVQRLRFALAIAGDPELVFLDEPTIAMDVEGRRSFWTMMRGFASEGRTVVFATHHLERGRRGGGPHRGAAPGHGGRQRRPPPPSRRPPLPGGCASCAKNADPARLCELDGVDAASVRGSEVVLDSLDPDATVRALVTSGVAFQRHLGDRRRSRTSLRGAHL